MRQYASIEEDEKYELNKKETILQNGMWFYMTGLWILTVILMFQTINTFEDNQKLLGTMVSLFAMLKFMSWIGHPRLILKRKD